MSTCTKFQSGYRGLQGRRWYAKWVKQTKLIQKTYRGHLHGRRWLRKRHESATKIQAMSRGVAWREVMRKRKRASTAVTSHYRGHQARVRVKKMIAAAAL